MGALFTNLLESIKTYSWRGVFERVRPLNSFLLRLSLAASDHITRENAIICLIFSRCVWALVRHSGLLFTSLYLKQCSTSLMRYYSGISKSELNQMSGPSVSLSRSGIPRLIPAHLRHVLAQRDDRADRLCRLYLTLFSVSRIIKLAKPISMASFKTMETPIEDIGSVKEILGMVKELFPTLQKLYLPEISSIPFEKGFRWKPTWKTTPNDDRQFQKRPTAKEKREAIEQGIDPKTLEPTLKPNIFTSVKYELAAFSRQVSLIHSWEGIFSPGILFGKDRILFALDNRYNTSVCNEDLDFYERTLGLIYHDLGHAFGATYLRSGKLGQVLVGAGKRRWFVMGNYVKQRLLYPVHVWGMSVLRTLPADGTFYQERPIERLFARGHRIGHFRACYDLSAATDRWPVAVIHDLMSCLFGSTLASCIVNGCLAINSCDFDGRISKDNSVEHHTVVFVAGQPLGYYGSWALFALSHHYLVWIAAYRCGFVDTPFTDYALLGDDLIIAHEEVSLEYRRLLAKLQVSISDSKSLVSHNGSLEFAKQFWITKNPKTFNGARGHTWFRGSPVNLSPISAQAVLATNSLVTLQQLAAKYNLSSKTVFKLSGAGYRVLGRLNSPSTLSRRWQRILALSDKHLRGKHTGYVDWWLGRGLPLSPYTFQFCVSFLRNKMKLKQLHLPPEEGWWSEGERVNSEYTLTRNWLSMWLQYLKWYSLTKFGPVDHLDVFFEAPIVTFTYHKEHKEEVTTALKAWGSLYVLFDKCADKCTPGWTPPVLDWGSLVGYIRSDGTILYPQ